MSSMTLMLTRTMVHLTPAPKAGGGGTGKTTTSLQPYLVTIYPAAFAVPVTIQLGFIGIMLVGLNLICNVGDVGRT